MLWFLNEQKTDLNGHWFLIVIKNGFGTQDQMTSPIKSSDSFNSSDLDQMLSPINSSDSFSASDSDILISKEPMKEKIWRNFVLIFRYRSDLINVIKPFFQVLKNNSTNECFNFKETYNLTNDLKKNKQLCPFFNVSSSNYIYQLIDDDHPSLPSDEGLKKIIQNDQSEELRQYIIDNQIHSSYQIGASFREVNMRIPILIYSNIQKATKCFKYLLLNGIEDLKEAIMTNEAKIFTDYDDDLEQLPEEHRYERDCKATAIYYGETEIIKILEEYTIKKGEKPTHIEAAILSYRNSTAKEIINYWKEWNETEIISQLLRTNLFASAKNNKIKGIEIL